MLFTCRQRPRSSLRLTLCFKAYPSPASASRSKTQDNLWVSVPGRFESLHDPLSSPCRLMRILGTIVETAPRPSVGPEVICSGAQSLRLFRRYCYQCVPKTLSELMT